MKNCSGPICRSQFRQQQESEARVRQLHVDIAKKSHKYLLKFFPGEDFISETFMAHKARSESLHKWNALKQIFMLKHWTKSGESTFVRCFLTFPTLNGKRKNLSNENYLSRTVRSLSLEARNSTELKVNCCCCYQEDNSAWAAFVVQRHYRLAPG